MRESATDDPGAPGADPAHGCGKPGGRRGGHWGGRHDRIERGALRLVLLDALCSAPRHGYDIIKAVEERTRGQYVPSPGTIYPTLQYLEDLGMVRSTQEADRRVYEITESGRAELSLHEERVNDFWARFESPGPSRTSQHEVNFLHEELEHLGRTVWCGLRGPIQRDEQETVRSVRRAVERCRDEIRSLIAAGPSTPDEASSRGRPGIGIEAGPGTTGDRHGSPSPILDSCDAPGAGNA